MKMTRNVVAAALAGVLLIAAGTSCGTRESSAARVSRLRLQHEVRPTGYQPGIGPAGQPQLVLDLLAVNRGREVLRSLTLLVVVVGADGNDRTSKRVTVDTSGLVPGVSAQFSALVEGIDVKEGETVLVELELDPPEGERSQFPEFAQGIS